MKSVVLIGSGNLAWHLGAGLKKSGYMIKQVYSRNLEHSKELANFLDAQAINELNKIIPDADFYFLLVPEQAFGTILNNMFTGNGFWIHCSGTSPLSIFDGIIGKKGVLYPVQTFSKWVPIEFSQIPLLLETTSQEEYKILSLLANSLSEFIYKVNSENRLIVHLAAVFANNFTNKLYKIAEDILVESTVPFQVLFPIIAETTRKMMVIGPEKAQTGPALRGDEISLERHRNLLKSKPELLAIYNLLSKEIQNSKPEN